jgi:hypothetical protein
MAMDRQIVQPPLLHGVFELPSTISDCISAPTPEELARWAPETPHPNVSMLANQDTAIEQESVLVLQQGQDLQHVVKPTCSLNLICYRPGSQGCVLRQIRVISRSRFDTQGDYDRAVKEEEKLICTDRGFFKVLRQEYDHDICGFWRRHLSLKTLRQIRLLSVSESARII